MRCVGLIFVCFFYQCSKQFVGIRKMFYTIKNKKLYLFINVKIVYDANQLLSCKIRQGCILELETQPNGRPGTWPIRVWNRVGLKKK